MGLPAPGPGLSCRPAGAVLLIPRTFRTHLRDPGQYEIRTWIALSLPMMVTAIIAAAMFQVDIVMLEILHPTENAVGQFGAAARICHPPGLPLAAMLILLTPLLGHIAGTARERSDRRRLFLWGSAVLLPVDLAMLAALQAFPHAILQLLGSGYGSGYDGVEDILRLLAMLGFVTGSFGIGTVLLQYAGSQRLIPWLSLATVLANIAGNALLIPGLGGIGAALASLAAHGGCSLAATAIAVYRLDLLPWRSRAGAL